ncbi:hypothetical protein JI435_421650 [Parastagonospora nodorum SN15]|uniref:Uncharacterized protein n=1 Tax=Phaeosphaeria nodorum (strain SN15 / ATCC MYA-4574 / FGSC 10173) TaxID=321614 RepID=A0A7U2FI55_PHANO|nr:hypothetical protein JI435_421650 [Parastagonospora nodorum SN15]
MIALGLISCVARQQPKRSHDFASGDLVPQAETEWLYSIYHEKRHGISTVLTLV